MKIVPLFAIALFVFMLAPVATVTASTPTYYIHVECFSTATEQASVRMTFLGHGVPVTCPASYGVKDNYLSIASTQTGTYKVNMNAGGHTAISSGKFNQNDCEDTGYVYGPGDYQSYAEFWIYSYQCD